MWMNFADLLLSVETNILGIKYDRENLVYLLFEFLVILWQFLEELMIDLNEIQKAVVTHKRLS